jgi:hypothetical protein
VSPAEINVTIQELRHATRPDQRTAYERALIALADLVDETTMTLDGEAKRGMTARQLHLVDTLRYAIPHKGQS